MTALIKPADKLKDFLKKGLTSSYREELIEKEGSFVSPFLSQLEKRTGRRDNAEEPSPSLSEIFRTQATRTGNYIGTRFLATSDKEMEKMGFRGFDNPVYPELSFLRRKNAFFAFRGNSYALPIIILDDEILSATSPYHPEKMIRLLEDIYTYGNHDYLHYLTAEIIDDGAVCSNRFFFKKGFLKKDFEQALQGAVKEISTSPADPLLENLSLASHALSFQGAMKDENFRVQYLRTIEDFISELDRIRSEISVPKGEREKIVSYFAHSALLGMARMTGLENGIIQEQVVRLMEMKKSPNQRFAEMSVQIERINEMAPHMTNVIAKLESGDPVFIDAVHRLETEMVWNMKDDMRLYLAQIPS